MVRPRIDPLKSALSFLRMTKGSSQLLVGPALSLESEQMKVRSSTRATSLADAGKGAGRYKLIAEEVVLRLRAVHPVNGRRLGEVGHLLHPANQVCVGG